MDWISTLNVALEEGKKVEVDIIQVNEGTGEDLAEDATYKYQGTEESAPSNIKEQERVKKEYLHRLKKNKQISAYS